MRATARATGTGKGQLVDVALVDAQTSWLANIGASFFATGKRPPRLGNAHPNVTPYQPIRARDKTMIVAVGNERLWAKFCKILGVADTLMGDPRFATNAQRTVHRLELVPLLEADSRDVATPRIGSSCSSRRGSRRDRSTFRTRRSRTSTSSRAA